MSKITPRRCFPIHPRRAATDDFALHDGDVGRWAAEGREAKAQNEERNFGKRCTRRGLGRLGAR
jgi:hypothetical protein